MAATLDPRLSRRRRLRRVLAARRPDILAAMGTVVAIVCAGGAAAGNSPAVLGLALLVVTVLALAAISRPVTVISTLLIIAPLLVGAPDTARTGLYLMPVIVVGVALLIVGRGEHPARYRAIDFVPVALLAAQVISALYGRRLPGPGTDDADLLRPLLETTAVGILWYYVAVFGRLGHAAAARILPAFFVAAIPLALAALLDSQLGFKPWGDPEGWADHSPARAIGTTTNPAALGALLGIGLAVAVAYLAWHGGYKRLRLVAIVAALLTVPALAVTLTRGPVVAAFATATVLLVTRSRLRFKLAWVAALLLIAVVATWSEIATTPVYEQRVSQGDTVSFREEMMDVSLRAAEVRPVLGWGFGTFDELKELPSLQSTEGLSVGIANNTSHDTFLTILVETGFVGLVLYVLPFLVISFAALRCALRSPGIEHRWALLACLGIVSCWALNALTIDMRFFSLLNLIAWMALGLMRRTLDEAARG